ncbi:unnamed protein product, partial [Brenthis ino]
MFVVTVISFLLNVLSISSTLAEIFFVKELPVSDNQIKDLAQAVCDEMLYGTVTNRNRCVTQFLYQAHSSYFTPSTSTIKIECNSDTQILFRITPSKYTQLVTLVPLDIDVNKTIEFSIIEPYQEKASLYPEPGKYTFWTTTINDTGFLSPWKRGPYIENFVPQREQKPYAINITFSNLLLIEDDFFVKANISWNSTDAADSLTVTNSCNKETQGNFYYKTIKPCERRNVILHNLFLNDTCTVTINGKYGVTKKVYHTPPCIHRECYKFTAQNVTLKAVWDENQDFWTVHVSWNRPTFAPDYYNATLRTNMAVQSVRVPGNATVMHFKNVKGREFFNVSLVAHANNRTAHTSARSLFPNLQLASKPLSGLLVGAWCSALVFVVLLVAAFCWKRRFHLTRSGNYYRTTMEKIPQDELDVDGMEAGTEDQWEVRPERLLLHEVIGEGAFGVVRRGTFAPANKEVAVKMLKDLPSVEEIRSFRAEMELMKSVGAHAHVVSLLACCSGRRLLIVAEYCSRGDLLSYLRCSWDIMLTRRNVKYYNNNKDGVNYRNNLFKSKTTGLKFAANRLYDLQEVCDTELTILDLLSFCRQIAMGMEFLASNRVVHRDLAARNILVTGDRTLKIADFGLSRDIYQENQYKQKGNGKMPVKWMALESLTHRIYTTQTDVWSFGVVVWEVVTVGGSPYAGVSAARLPRLLAAGYRMPRPPNCSTALYDLMLSCWNERPRARPTFSELHARLDDLLCACADHYMSLAVPTEVPEIHSKPYRYVRKLIRGRRKRSKNYERPLAAPTNHYTEQPVIALT